MHFVFITAYIIVGFIISNCKVFSGKFVYGVVTKLKGSNSSLVKACDPETTMFLLAINGVSARYQQIIQFFHL